MWRCTAVIQFGRNYSFQHIRRSRMVSFSCRSLKRSLSGASLLLPSTPSRLQTLVNLGRITFLIPSCHYSTTEHIVSIPLQSDANRTCDDVSDGEESVEGHAGSGGFTCAGCGSVLQAEDASEPGYVPIAKISELQHAAKEEEPDIDKDTNSVTEQPVDGSDIDKETNSVTEEPIDGIDSQNKSPPLVVCKRCFSLKHYNTALNITLKASDYLRHLAHLKDKRALIILMVDLSDFPGSLFPNLNTLVSSSHQIILAANKVDLLPHDVQRNTSKLESMLIRECRESSLAGCKIAKVHFICAKSGTGVESLANSVLQLWGNRGDVYLLGCTNVGKSSLFNHLLVALCGAIPGKLSLDSNTVAPAATISQWPGTTLGLLSFPIISGGKRRRLLTQARKAALLEVQQTGGQFRSHQDGSGERMSFAFSKDAIVQRQLRRLAGGAVALEEEDALTEVGLRTKPLSPKVQQSFPENKYWLHDTPGAINDAQLINHLTTEELRLALPKRALKPRSFILKPGECMLVGGLARIDYTEGPVSAYFTVFAASFLPIHTTKITRADDVYSRNLGSNLLKIPCGDKERLDQFPALEPKDLSVRGCGWNTSVADVILSSVGWVAVTMGEGKEVCLRAFTPGGRGMFLRTPSLYPTAIIKRGKRSRKGNRTNFF